MHWMAGENGNGCNALFVMLLHIHGQRDIPSSAFIREFFETARCDPVFNMAPHRAEYEKKLTADRLARIMAFKATDQDESVAAQATMHYYTWHESRLLKAISWPAWLYHQTLSRAMVGFGAGAYGGGGGMSAALNSFRYLRSRRPEH